MKLIKSCGACAAQLPDLGAKQCSHCKTRYCGPECQVQHWKKGGHDKLCKKIKKAGGAEQYYADRKCAEAVAVAVEKCADDTKGQTCYICLEALHPRTGEGLVRGCACGDREGVDSGTTGIAHVSCLAEQAKILCAEAEENNLDDKVKDARWRRWDTCSLCEQRYHGVVCCALGWACWKTYLGRPDGHWTRRTAMQQLGCGLAVAGHNEDALSVMEAHLSMQQRQGAPERDILCAQNNLANMYAILRQREAVHMFQKVYLRSLELYGASRKETIDTARNYINFHLNLRYWEGAKRLSHKWVPVAQRVLGEHSEKTLRMRWVYARSLYEDPAATPDDLREAVTTLEDVTRIAQRVLGGAHPLVVHIDDHLRKARAALRAREEPSPGAP